MIVRRTRRSRRPIARILLGLSGIACLAAASPTPVMGSSATATPRVFIIDAANLVEARERAQRGDPSLTAALFRLRGDGARALSASPLSVTQKKQLPPSGNKHDYLSLAPYWWPDPNRPDGMPYVRRDGEINPERDEVPDKKYLEKTIATVRTLSLCFFFTGEEKYAEHAARMLRVWFIDEGTRMNPHLKYAQAVRGRNQGRSAGIIETHNLVHVVDAVGLLSRSKSWSPEDQERLQSWFAAYLEWLSQSPEGRAEGEAQNNHGSWYDAQIAAFALFVDRRERARQVLAEMPQARIAKQIEPDGRQPRELQRKQPWSYSLFNLEALFSGASLAEHVGVDLWNFQTADGRGMRKALEWLIPFATGEKTPARNFEKLMALALEAARRYRDPALQAAIEKIPTLPADSRLRLLYFSVPPMPSPPTR